METLSNSIAKRAFAPFYVSPNIKNTKLMKTKKIIKNILNMSLCYNILFHKHPLKTYSMTYKRLLKGLIVPLKIMASGNNNRTLSTYSTQYLNQFASKNIVKS